ncbi:MAG: amidase [Paeniglutamicibacter sp.]
MTAAHASIGDMSRRLREGSTNAGELAGKACDNAARSGSVFITVARSHAQQAAAASDKLLVRAAPRSILEGIPFAVKDVIDTLGVPTTMASRQFAANIPDADANIVHRLKTAGAVMMGKTNSHEFSYGIRGDVGAFGIVCNPHDAQRIAGGSSSGSAAAVALGCVPLAVGTDTAGSVRLPAALCGVVGFMPSRGLLPTDGIFPLARSFDTAGYMASCVADIEMAMESTVPGFVAHIPAAASRPLAYAALNQLRADVADSQVGLPYDQVTGQVAATGIEMSTLAEHAERFGGLYDLVRSHEAYQIHRPLLERSPEKYQPSTLQKLQAGASIGSGQVRHAAGQIMHLSEQFLSRFSGSDILISPTVPILAPLLTDDGADIPRQLMSHCVIWNVLGWPAVTLPYWVPGCPLPQSVQLIAKPGEDATLLRAARQVEGLIRQGAAAPSVA